MSQRFFIPVRARPRLLTPRTGTSCIVNFTQCFSCNPANTNIITLEANEHVTSPLPALAHMYTTNHGSQCLADEARGMMRFSFFDTRRGKMKQACLSIPLSARVTGLWRSLHSNSVSLGCLVTHAGEVSFRYGCHFFSFSQRTSEVVEIKPSDEQSLWKVTTSFQAAVKQECMRWDFGAVPLHLRKWSHIKSINTIISIQPAAFFQSSPSCGLRLVLSLEPRLAG